MSGQSSLRVVFSILETRVAVQYKPNDFFSGMNSVILLFGNGRGGGSHYRCHNSVCGSGLCQFPTA